MEDNAEVCRVIENRDLDLNIFLWIYVFVIAWLPIYTLKGDKNRGKNLV